MTPLWCTLDVTRLGLEDSRRLVRARDRSQWCTLDVTRLWSSREAVEKGTKPRDNLAAAVLSIEVGQGSEMFDSASREAAARYSFLDLARKELEKDPIGLGPDERAHVERLVERKLILEDAILSTPLAKGVEVAEESVLEAVNGIIERFDSVDDYHAGLATNGLSPEDHRHALRRELAIELVMARVSEEVPKPEEPELRAIYDAHPASFSKPETREAHHILIITEDDASEQKQDEVAARLRDMKEEACRPGGFAPLAERYSECPSAMHGGKIGDVPRGTLFPELDEVLFTLEPGAVAGPIRSEVGWHLLMCAATHPAGQVSFEEARDALAEDVYQKQVQQHRRVWLRELVRYMVPNAKDGSSAAS